MPPAVEGPTAGSAKAQGMAGWLSLAATPACIVMAVMTVVTGGATMVCSSLQEPSPLNEMATMYLLMAAFHSPPWLRLVANRRNRAGMHARVTSPNRTAG
ncbi:hypothetical protein GHJ82_20705 [Sinorhizobium saheli]|uniref:Uncharacterized protein n=2 Tax=Sinorhizobium saheli TaxID=36856 RepID=A0A178YDL8_SINSA|nr:hypothetical protein [Sinorhizobium saheli]OAP44935.1 hypothetical protein ATB98_19030 [Sinorhizobium saheli]